MEVFRGIGWIIHVILYRYRLGWWHVTLFTICDWYFNSFSCLLSCGFYYVIDRINCKAFVVNLEKWVKIFFITIQLRKESTSPPNLECGNKKTWEICQLLLPLPHSVSGADLRDPTRMSLSGSLWTGTWSKDVRGRRIGKPLLIYIKIDAWLHFFYLTVCVLIIISSTHKTSFKTHVISKRFDRSLDELFTL